MTTATGLVGTAGLTIRMLLWDRDGLVWNGTAYETFAAGSWANYIITATEYGTLTGIYLGSIPSAAQSAYARATFHQGTTQSAVAAVDEGVASADVRRVNQTAVGGVGTAATPWGPA